MALTRAAGLVTGAATVFLLSACTGLETSEGALVTGVIPPSHLTPQHEPLSLGKRSYGVGDYGLAERHFRQAVEANPKSVEAWLGLAASYDQLRRFDLAQRAYDRVLALEGRSPSVLNNLGYHYMLKGNLGQARALLLEAAEKDPGNVIVQGNLRLLDTWSKGEPSPATPR
jgi:Flp pilus assembly protein TadD